MSPRRGHEDSGAGNFLIGLAFVLIVASVAHFLFSSLGFNPTDDGYVLATSRRIVDGQVPHRDFISVRPAGSNVLHAPFVMFGGDYSLWLSRYFVWIQFALISWVWTVILARSFDVFRSLPLKITVASIAFCFTAHIFPVMAWFQIDALFVISIGALLCLGRSQGARLAGYMIMGTSVLFKQNYLPVTAGFLVLLGDWRKWRYWIAACLPSLVYVFYVTAKGGLTDAVVQLTTRTELLTVGFVDYLKTETLFVGIAVGALAAYLSTGRFGRTRQETTAKLMRVASAVLLTLFLIGGAASIGFGKHPAFGIFGVVLSLTVIPILRDRRLSEYTRFGLLFLLIGWCTSISIGYNSPGLANGPSLLFLLVTIQLYWPATAGKELRVGDWGHGFLRRAAGAGSYLPPSVLLVCLALTTVFAFKVARTDHIYRDRPARFLNRDLGDVLPGARLIRTNDRTFAFLEDLKTAEDSLMAEGKVYCIVPDLAVCWMRSGQPNPLCSDWPINDGLGKQACRAIDEVEARRPDVVVIVQKYMACGLPARLTPVHDKIDIVRYVRSNLTKTGETEFFDLYE